MTTPPSLPDLRAALAALLPGLQERHGVRALSIFGSFARGEQSATSDLDVLVEFDEPPGLFGFVTLADELEDRLGVPVDLFTRPMLKPRLAARVEADRVAV